MTQPKGKTAREAAQGEAQNPVDGSSVVGQSSGAEIAALQAQVGEIQTRNEQVVQGFIGWLVQRATTTDEDQYAIMASIIGEILEAESADEVLRERSSIRISDIVGIPLIMHGFEIREGKYEDSLTGHYAAITVSSQGSDTNRVVTTGAAKILAKLMKLDQLGEWPQIIVFTSKEASSGNTVYDMVKPTI